MAILYSYREGYLSERLANYILSKFSFIAKPETTLDDVGVDYFCTVFKKTTNEGKSKKVKFLYPIVSFAIQIKSDSDDIDITNKTKYLDDLEFPYFVGVVNREENKLTFYSGASVPHFFSKFGPDSSGYQKNPSIKEDIKVIIKLIECPQETNKYYKIDGNTYYLNFNRFDDFYIDFKYTDNNSQVTQLINTCIRIQENISSKKNNEFFFKDEITGDYNCYVYAGPGSAEIYQENLYKRVTEAFLNIAWKHRLTKVFDLKNKEIPKLFRYRKEELETYNKIYEILLKDNSNLPPYLKKFYSEINNQING